MAKEISKGVPRVAGLETVYLPAKEKGPLLVVLHGLGDSVEGYRFLPQFLGLSPLSYLLVNAPDSYFTGYSWFDIEGNPEPGVLRSREKLFSLLDQLREQGWRPQEIGLFGFSQGALMALDLAVRYPHTLGAIVAISGFVYFLEKLPLEFSSQAMEQKLLVTHGLQDPMLPIGLSRGQVKSLQDFGMDIRWREYQKDHTIEPVKEAAEIRAFLQENLLKRNSL